MHRGSGRALPCAPRWSRRDRRGEAWTLEVLLWMARDAPGGTVSGARLFDWVRFGDVSMQIGQDMSLDRLEGVLRRFQVGVALFHTGPLCGTQSFDARPGRGLLHVLRGGEARKSTRLNSSH